MLPVSGGLNAPPRLFAVLPWLPGPSASVSAPLCKFRPASLAGFAGFCGGASAGVSARQGRPPCFHAKFVRRVLSGRFLWASGLCARVVHRVSSASWAQCQGHCPALQTCPSPACLPPGQGFLCSRNQYSLPQTKIDLVSCASHGLTLCAWPPKAHMGSKNNLAAKNPPAAQRPGQLPL